MSFRLLALGCTVLSALSGADPAAVLGAMHRANHYFQQEWPDPGQAIVTNRTRPSNIWTRGVYYEGLMALYAVDPQPADLRYAVAWGEAHRWGLRSGPRTRSADDQCCGQTYLDLCRLAPHPLWIEQIRQSLTAMAQSPGRNDWTWIDAIQMSLPAFVKLGAMTGDSHYFTTGHELFLAARDGSAKIPPLFNPQDGLWWRDATFVPPYRTPAGRQSYWARGNGWVMAAMVRAIDGSPAGSPGRSDYVAMLQRMALAVKAVQREDGFWNVNLDDPADFGGKETTGTALFTYALAAGIRLGVLPAADYAAAAERGWHALVSESLHPDGFLGRVQGSGKQPSEGQPVTYDHRPDFDDFGVGCFLLAGSEIYHLADRPR